MIDRKEGKLLKTSDAILVMYGSGKQIFSIKMPFVLLTLLMTVMVFFLLLMTLTSDQLFKSFEMNIVLVGIVLTFLVSLILPLLLLGYIPAYIFEEGICPGPLIRPKYHFLGLVPVYYWEYVTKVKYTHNFNGNILMYIYIKNKNVWATNATKKEFKKALKIFKSNGVPVVLKK